MTSTAYAVLLDLDGTLVDSVYHHVLAWDRALRDHGRHVALRRIHAGIGLGGDRLVPWLLGGRTDDAEALIEAHSDIFAAYADDLRPTAGARALLEDLEQRGVPHLVATSAGTSTREILLGALGREDLETTDGGDVESSKPAPDLLAQACSRLDVAPGDAIIVGDSAWDALAARRLGMAAIAVRCGGVADADLLRAGAQEVVNTPRDLIARL
jgi:HAD superfamily hydrolase (TIGR01509 family)